MAGVEDYLFEDVTITESNAPRFILNGEEVDIWDGELSKYHSLSVADYLRESLLEFEERGTDPFPEIIGKKAEKEMLKNALISGSNILFKGMKGYGKTTFSKAIAKLLPEKILAVKGCKINDDPTKPVCFSCKRALLEDNEVELTWVGRKWVRILGDPMMTTRQLIGGLSIQKIREGYDIDSPEVFTPGRILKAHRGIAYVDELGAIPSAMQTLLHELLEEKQITTPEGDIIPLKIDTIFISSTNPANYRGTADIKEPLLDRMEEIFIGPPETLEEEILIGLRNMRLKDGPLLPDWHLRILARTVRLARAEDGSRFANRIEVEPSCRATIKLFDHVKASALRANREAVILADYGRNYENVKLAMRSRMELDYEDVSKDEVISALVEDAINRTSMEIYSKIPKEEFRGIVEDISELGEINIERAEFSDTEHLFPFVNSIASSPAEYSSALEILLEALRRCTGVVTKVDVGKYECARAG
ncbi:MAG: AAA family ATPase [Archaeoglobus sp.]|nr:AAA family ATPase [Archaeoglobus sp.]